MNGLQGGGNPNLINSLNDIDCLNNADGKSCKYYEIEEFQNMVGNISKNFSSISLNIRSLTGKLGHFHEFVNDINCNNFKFSFISIQETWNIPVHLNTDIPGYKPLIYKIRDSTGRSRNNIGGGVGCWVRNIYEHEILENLSYFEDKFFESLFIKVKTGKKRF